MTIPAPLRRLLRLAGIDRAVGLSLVPSIFSRLAGPIQVAILGLALSEIERGYFYTFGSVLALQVFFELGLGSVVATVIAHERGQLELLPNGRLVGDPVAKARLIGVFRQAVTWYTLAAGLLACVVLPVGWQFFATAEGSADVDWAGPWVALALVTALALATTPLFTALYGYGLVTESARLGLVRTLANYAAMWGVFLAGGKLYSVAAGAAASVVAALWAVYRDPLLRGCVADLTARGAPAGGLSWWAEIWPLQWRVAVTSLGSYFSYQLFVPVLFRYSGPAAAGRMGMTMNVLYAVSVFATTWTAVRLPHCCHLIARRRWAELDRYYFPAAVRSVAVVALGGVGLLVASALLRSAGHRYGELFLGPLDQTLLVVAVVAVQVVVAQGAYLRAHKAEPFVLQSIVCGGAIALATALLGPKFGATGMLAGYLVINLVVGLGWSSYIFARCRAAWHAAPSDEIVLAGDAR